MEHASSNIPAAGQGKPLPTLPGPQATTATKMGPVENIPRSRSGSSTAGEIIRRVSSMFSSRKKRPSALKLAHRNISKIYESRNSSLQSVTDSEEDDIRRPSGLGSAVSLSSNRSMPPSPFTPSYNPDSISATPFGYVRTRATSTPNLLRSFSLQSKGSKRKVRPLRGNSVSHNGSEVQLRTRSTITISCIPAETMAIIFLHLPKSDIAQIARTCRLFLSASRMVLYTHIDLGELTGGQLEKFVALLASRRDFTELVRTFCCESWSRFFLPTTSLPSSWSSPVGSVASPTSTSTSASSSMSHPIHDPDVQHRNTLLTATFTLAFQRMSNLTSLTLPTYDHDLLAHHTAFGLRSITFMCSTLSREEANELFAWLDGQTNITTLLFPNLSHDCDYGVVESPVKRSHSTTSARPATSSGLVDQSQGQGKKYLVAPFLVPLLSASPTSSPTPTPIPTPRPSPATKKLSARPKTAAPSSPSYNTMAFPGSSSGSGSGSSSPSHLPSPYLNSHVPFPSSSSTSVNKFSNVVTSMHGHKQYQTSPLTSPTLLPNLTTLHGPPSLIIALSSPPSETPDTFHRPRPRPLKTITLNISSTLYSGLRPATLVQRLIGVTRSLGLCFGESVDRRTVEKVLGAAGSVLGGGGCGMERGKEQEEKGKGKDGKDGVGEFGKGYKFGEGEWKGLVELDVKFVAIGGPGSDEALHKMISSTIPRYPHLRVLRLSYLQDHTNHNPSYSSVHVIHTPNASSPLPRASPTNSNSPATLTPTEGLGFVVHVGQWPRAARKELSPPEQAYIRQWTKHCPDLERVVFLSEAEWWRRRK